MRTRVGSPRTLNVSASAAADWSSSSRSFTATYERVKRVDADAEHLRLRLIQPRERIAERAQLLRAHAAERRGEKGEHDRLSLLLAELDRLPILVGQGKVRCVRSDVYSHRPPSTQLT